MCGIGLFINNSFGIIFGFMMYRVQTIAQTISSISRGELALMNRNEVFETYSACSLEQSLRPFSSCFLQTRNFSPSETRQPNKVSLDIETY